MAKGDIDTIPRNRSATKRQKVTPKRSAAAPTDADHRGLYTGLIRLHVLHHAAKETVYGFAMIEELRRHGYELSAGTLYPILHGLEQKGFLRSDKERDGRTERRVYRATPAGRKALAAAKAKVRELFGELFEDEEGGGP
jgi:DNA-binding PadR family transcriptional regulator